MKTLFKTTSYILLYSGIIPAALAGAFLGVWLGIESDIVLAACSLLGMGLYLKLIYLLQSLYYRQEIV